MRILIKARPNSREEIVKKISENNFEVSVKEPPVKGLANKAIIRMLASYFHISPLSIKIISGYTSRQKIVELNL